MVDTGSTPLLSKNARRTLVAGLSAPILAFALFSVATINQNASWEKLFSATSMIVILPFLLPLWKVEGQQVEQTFNRRLLLVLAWRLSHYIFIFGLMFWLVLRLLPAAIPMIVAASFSIGTSSSFVSTDFAHAFWGALVGAIVGCMLFLRER